MVLPFAELKDQSRCVELHEPKEEGKVIASVHAVPESADDKGDQLRSSLRKRQSIIDALPQPLLDSHIPVADLVSDVNSRLDFPRIADLDSQKLISFGVWLIADAAHVHGELGKLPSKVVLAFNERNGPERVEQYIEMPFLVKFVSFHVVDWEVDHLDDVKPSAERADSEVFKGLLHAIPERDAGKTSLLVDVSIISGVIDWSIEDAGGNELQVSQVIDERWQFHDFILSFVGVF